jgi:triphosphatase
MAEVRDDPARLVRAAAAECLAQLERNVDGARRGDAESLHQLRIGVRRLRALRPLGRSAGLAPADAQVRRDLKWLSRLLGAMRDWDVFIGETWPAASRAVASRTERPQIEAVAADLREASHAELRRALGGRRFRQLLRTLHASDAGERDEAKPVPPHVARSGKVGRLLSRRAKQVARRGRHIGRLDDEGLHRLRIRVKALRYLGEFVAASDESKTSGRYLKRLAAVQTSLGHLNDLAVSARLIDRIASTAGVRPGGSAGERWHAYSTRRDTKLRARLANNWKKFAKTRPFWD